MLRSLAISLCLCASVSLAQETPVTTASSGTLSVYLDCQNAFCDFDYFRTELTMVNWVRDRAVADIHLLVTSQETGAGGREYSVTFIGLRQFAGITDTLKYASPPAAPDDDVRKGLAGVFKLGLVRYFARTPAAARLTIGFGTQTGQQAQTSTRRDPWKAWVFEVGFDGFAFAEEKFKDYNRRSSLSANRTTENWKTQIRFGHNISESRFTFPTCSGTPSVCRDTTDVNIRRGDDASLLQVKSLTSHLSAGLRLNTFSSTFENYRRVVRILPAIEYNFFPYSQSTRQQLTVEYNLGYGYFSYEDTTAFDKLDETMPMQRLAVGVTSRQPWGSIDVGSNYTGYFDSRRLYRIGVGGDLSLQMIKGLRFNVFGNYQKIQDQFNLRKADLTPEEILTRQFQLGTGYSFWGGVGFSYTFGSIYNNVVNPRMRGSGF